jgi:hypothetical protein
MNIMLFVNLNDLADDVDSILAEIIGKSTLSYFLLIQLFTYGQTGARQLVSTFNLSGFPWQWWHCSATHKDPYDAIREFWLYMPPSVSLYFELATRMFLNVSLTQRCNEKTSLFEDKPPPYFFLSDFIICFYGRGPEHAPQYPRPATLIIQVITLLPCNNAMTSSS